MNKVVGRAHFRQNNLNIGNVMLKIIIRLFVFVFVTFFTSSIAIADNGYFDRFGFGIGVSLTVDLGTHDRVEEAIVDSNGRVRVTKERNDIPRLMLESHYFFPFRNNSYGWGPFISLQPGNNEVIDAIGMGVMIGLKRKDETKKTKKDKNIEESNNENTDNENAENIISNKNTASWNLGIGGILDPGVRTLGDDIIENKLLPSGETEIRYKETSQWGLLIIASYSF